MLRVPERDLRYNDEEGIYYYGDRPFTGVAFRTYPSGSPMTETQYEDGLFHGISRGFWESGKPETETSYAFGGQHGKSRSWYANGQLAEEDEAECAIIVRRKKWDEAGNLVEEWELKESDPNYEVLLHCRKAYAGEAPSGS
jgi:antitoxin component YwqK of YwqJK toxin-antitoxin module